MRIKLFSRAALLALLGMGGCQGGEFEADLGTPIDESWEAFKREAIVLSDEEGPVYIFGGDMKAVGEADLRAEYERYFGADSVEERDRGVGQMHSSLTVDANSGVDNLLRTTYSDSAGGRHLLSYCIQRSSFTAQELAALEPALNAAVRSWNSLVNIEFRHDPNQDATCNDTNANVFFNVRKISGSFFGNAFFPDDVRIQRELWITAAGLTTTAFGRDLEGILRHELGHMLGFRHEHIWINPDCSDETIIPENDPNGAPRLVTSYDADSIMHYPQCRPSPGGGYRQTLLDYQGAIQLYGLATSAIAATVI